MLIHLGVIDDCLLLVYFAFVLGIGFVVKKGVGGTKDFFESGRWDSSAPTSARRR
jgi:hypothetical protein